MKKILLVSYLFAPENMIGAVRPTKLAKYFTLMGNEVEIITTSYKKKSDDALLKDIPEAIKINELNHSTIIEKYNNRKHNIGKNNTVDKRSNKSNENCDKLNIISIIKTYLFHVMNIFVAYDFYFSFKKYMRTNKTKYSDYDIIFTTFGPLASILCGLHYKKKNPEIYWICDFRDPMVVDILPKFINRYNLKIQEMACKTADRIVAVSHGYLKRICKGRYQYKSSVISNGFDKADLPLTYEFNKINKFSFAYTGTLYNGKRELSPIFRVINELIKENLIDINDVVFNYAGSDFSSIQSQASKYELEIALVNHGYLSRTESIKLQKESRFLLLSTWNSEHEIGVFPGKFLEYMLLEKPIISVVNGNLPNSEVTKIMDKANLGVSYEYARHDADYQVLREYIKKEYIRFKSGYQPEFYPVENLIEEYNYKNIARQFEEIF